MKSVVTWNVVHAQAVGKIIISDSKFQSQLAVISSNFAQ